MPTINDLVVKVGPVGPTGATGSSGANMPEPASGTNGRRNAAWSPVLPLSGGNANALTGGVFISNTIASSATDVSKHINLGWGTNQYGFCITGSTLNCVAYQRHAFTTNIQMQCEFRYKQVWFSTDGWGFRFNDTTGALIYTDWNGNSLFGWLADYGGRVVSWTHAYQSSSGDNVVQVNGGGVWYYNIGSNKFNFNWDGTVYGRVDNAVQFPFQRACDEWLKQDIAPSTFDCLEAIRKIRVYQFRWKDYRDPRKPKPAPDDAPTIPIGFIAQRLYEDFPEAVVRTPRLIDKGAQAMWSGDANTLMATLIGAIQQLDEQVNALSW